MLIALLSMVLSALSVSGLVTAVLGGLLVLVVPGYVVGYVLWDSKSDLTIANRITFSVGLSVSLSVFDVLLLSLFGIGIFPLTVTVALGYETLVFGTLAVVLRLARKEGLPHEVVEATLAARRLLASDRAFWALVASLLLVAAVLIALTVTVPSPTASTQFYVLGPDGTTSTLPRTLTVNQSATVLVGVRDASAGTVLFTVTACLTSANGSCASSSSSFADWASVLPFGPNQTYRLNLSAAGTAGAERSLRFTASPAGGYVLSLVLDGGGTHREVRLPLVVTP